ncbi:MAG: hypothetical protein JO301_10350 [Chitinophagaceae bacterium]|nr:hypothetical protein [Chitinophagaceae bacterium]
MKPAITIHNYEQYFLLYADGELSAADEQAVLQFVQENRAFAAELELLQQLKLPVESVEFAEKEMLFRTGAAEINLDNYETYFLLYVDRELSSTERMQVETFVLQHPALQEEFLLLKQAQLQPEALVFAAKASLYRKEEKKRPVIFMHWQRIAVAAALIGIAVTGWFLFPSGKETGGSIMANRVPVAASPAKNEPAASHAAPERVQTIASNRDRATDKHIDPAVADAAPEKQEGAALIPDQNATARVDAEPVSSAPVNGNAGNDRAVQTPTAVTGNGFNKNMIAEAADTHPDNPVLVQPAVYKELDTEDEKKSLYVGSLEINKDKLRGFFRKASSLFRGKAKQQEEEKAEATPSSSNTRSLR